MRCPYCKFQDTKVIDSRPSNEDTVIRRRRSCEKCEKRFTTYEKVEHIPLLVIKKDQIRQTFDRNKVLQGIMRACEKRPVSYEMQQTIVDGIEKMLDDRENREVRSSEIGEYIMEKLSLIDQVAYVRFASVYREFKDLNHFMKELKTLLNKK